MKLSVQIAYMRVIIRHEHIDPPRTRSRDWRVFGWRAHKEISEKKTKKMLSDHFKNIHGHFKNIKCLYHQTRYAVAGYRSNLQFIDSYYSSTTVRISRT